MLTRLVAQELVDGLSAISLGVAVFSVAREGSSAPLKTRLVYAFGGLCLFFAARAASEASSARWLGLLTLGISCALPPAALVLTEGALRRHAPTLLKTAIVLGALAILAALYATGGRPPVSSWVLGGYVTAVLCSLTVLLVARDRLSLSRQENAGVDALVSVGSLLTLLSVSDFLPLSPVGLSGIGAAAAAFVLSANPASAVDAKSVLADLLATTVLAILSALALALVLRISERVEQARLAAVILSLLLASGAILSSRRRRGASGPVRNFARALVTADLSTLDAYLNSLVDQPLLADLRLAEGSALEDYDMAALGETLAKRPVWTQTALEGPASTLSTRVKEELSDLMARTEATHATLLSQSPLRIALVTLPGLGPTGAEMIDLALFHKLAVVASRDQR